MNRRMFLCSIPAFPAVMPRDSRPALVNPEYTWVVTAFEDGKGYLSQYAWRGRLPTWEEFRRQTKADDSLEELYGEVLKRFRRLLGAEDFDTAKDQPYVGWTIDDKTHYRMMGFLT